MLALPVLELDFHAFPLLVRSSRCALSSQCLRTSRPSQHTMEKSLMAVKRAITLLGMRRTALQGGEDCSEYNCFARTRNKIDR